MKFFSSFCCYNNNNNYSNGGQAEAVAEQVLAELKHMSFVVVSLHSLPELRKGHLFLVMLLVLVLFSGDPARLGLDRTDAAWPGLV